MILENGICSLSSLFKMAFLDVTYTAYNAKRWLVQLPIVTFRINEPSSGSSMIMVMEYVHSVDYSKFAHFLSACATHQANPVPVLSKKWN